MAGGVVTTGNVPRLLQEGINSIFGRSYDEHPVEWDRIFDTSDSRKAFELDVQLEGMGLAERKPEGTDIAFDDFTQGFTPKYVALTYAKGYIATEEALEDELYDQLMVKAEALAFSMAQTKEVVGANILNRAFNAAFTMIDGDGVSLLNAAHVNGPSGGTFSNQLTVAANLSESSLEDIDILIGKATDARGLKIALQATRLIIPTDLKFTAQRILGSVLQNDTANNATNALRDLDCIRDGFTLNHYLTSAQSWFVKTNAPRGMRHFNRRNVSFKEDNAFSTGNARFKADERYSFGWTDPRGMYGSAGV